MADIKSQAVQESNASNKKEILPLSDVFTMTLRHWPWIILSVVICVGFATLYILRTPKVYTRSAEIQIKDNEDGAAPTEFKDLGLFQSSSNVQDEIAILDSRDLMEEVVRRLNLDNSYYREGFFQLQKKEFREYPQIQAVYQLLKMPDKENLQAKNQNLEFWKFLFLLYRR